MSAKRRWSQWPTHMKGELNGVSGVAGVGGTAIAIGGWSFLAGTAALSLTGVGALITIGAVGYAAYKAIPPLLRHPKDLVGESVELDKLKDVSPRLKTLAIVGPSQAGKTTLRNRLSFEYAPVTRTQQITAHIASLQVAPPAYLAILDGGGESYPQQFKLAEVCDYLCIVIDHNVSDRDVTIDEHRLNDHKSFLRQIRHLLDESSAPKKQWIYFLWNKHDLWQGAPDTQKANFNRFCEDQVQLWRNVNLAKSVESRPHSNDVQDDVSRLMEFLKQSVTPQ